MELWTKFDDAAHKLAAVLCLTFQKLFPSPPIESTRKELVFLRALNVSCFAAREKTELKRRKK
jgi:hypothetical protein